ncbi:pyrimidodiazepine synthase-like [Anthonomus grandis grandis]|uniref:pyrimidodiazepine synthase-like n=1 Tax=Anthonomus grandis grandis TaxID=2921223 RepID=UPI002165F36A|nr:pyrimidodiazepine synthase-like [Anthonomus grandis grandis]XP_050297684.1 pyrimidodiazepine synthase-like [Anthonomus grandis grandis]
MSSKHLSKGSTEPPRVDGLLRLYSMLFCPYAQRSRLVLKAKNIPHEIVNINLMQKPEWYFKIHTEGKVPALLDGDKIIVESLDICDYLDEKYPENPLYPAEPAAKEKDKQVIQQIGSATSIFGKILFSNEEKSPEEWVKEIIKALQPLEDELVARGTKFFGGDKPGMIDYMLWPWAERAGAIALKLGTKLPITDDHIPQLRKWRKAMREDPVVAELYLGPEAFWKVAQITLKKEVPDYDSILSA